jgi:hypothetical protein
VVTENRSSGALAVLQVGVRQQDTGMAVLLQEQALHIRLGRQKMETAVPLQEQALHVSLWRQKTEPAVSLPEQALHVSLQQRRTGTAVPSQEQATACQCVATENRSGGAFAVQRCVRKSRPYKLDGGDIKPKQWSLCKSRHRTSVRATENESGGASAV